MSTPSSEPDSVVMWEARAAAGRLTELVAWADTAAGPEASLFASEQPDPRVVLIDPTGRGLPEPPAELVVRAPHAWRFAPVERSGDRSS